ncbi:hypothetical protein U1Q18_016725 [Sarracenia purpurea var. burkii]
MTPDNRTILSEMRSFGLIFLAIFRAFTNLQGATSHGEQPLSRIAINMAVVALEDRAYVKASPSILGLRGQNTEWVTVEYGIPNPSIDDWVGVFSPANFSDSTCLPVNVRTTPPLLCTAPIKFQFANYNNPKYTGNGKGLLKLQLINQRSNFSFALFSGGLSKVFLPRLPFP